MSAALEVVIDAAPERIREALGSVADAVVEIPDPGFFVPARPDAEIPAFQGGDPKRPVVFVPLAAPRVSFA